MSNEMAVIKGSGKNRVDLQFSRFYGGIDHGEMLQLTQGFAGSQLGSSDPDEPGFIQLTKHDARQLVNLLDDWLRSKH